MIQTRRHMMFDIEASDVKNIYAGLGDPEVTKYYGVHFDSLQDTEKQMEWYRSLQEKEEGHWWKVMRIKTGHFIGACGFNDWNKEQKKAEIGIWLLPRYWGKGRMSEVMKATISYGFDRMGLETIEAFVEAENLACLKAMEKTGMEFVECQKDAEIKNGKSIDIHVFQIHSEL